MTTTPHVPRWYEAEAPTPKAHSTAKGSVVEAVRLHLDETHRQALEQLAETISRAGALAMNWIKERLTTTCGEDPTGTTNRKRVLVADLKLDLGLVATLPTWAEKIFRDCSGPTNCPKETDAVRIAWGEEKDKAGSENGGGKYWQVSHRSAKFELQQLLLKILPSHIFADIPAKLRPGVTQELAQQLTSHVMLMDSGTVKEAVFPSVADRDPKLKREQWESAVNEVCQRSEPFSYQKARELMPGKFKENDKRGERLVNVDPVWAKVVSSPEVKLLPLLYVSGGDVRLYRWIRPGRRNGSAARTTLAALPISSAWLASQTEEVRRHLTWWRNPTVTSQLSPLTPSAGKLTARSSVLLIPLSYGRKRTEKRILPALQRLPIQWGRLVRRNYRRGQERIKWFLQLTIGYATPPVHPRLVLGIHLGIDDVYFWHLSEENKTSHSTITAGSRAGNPILEMGLGKKAGLEWDQQRGRWVGGKVYGKHLRSITHTFVDQLISQAIESRRRPDELVGLAIEKIRWVDKRGGGADANKRFSAWNYGQLLTYLTYKAKAAGIAVTEVWPNRDDRALDDKKLAQRVTELGVKRFRQRRLAAEKREDEK